MQNHDIVTFHYNGKTLNYQVICAFEMCILTAYHHAIDIFELLEIKDRYAFCESIVGYRSKGWFPEMKSTEDLEKLVHALYQKISEKEKVFEETYKLNFNVKPLKF